MHNITRALVLSAATLVLIAPAGCGDDDGDAAGDGDPTTTTAGSSDSTDSGTTDSGSDSDSGDSGVSTFPSDEFCDAVADFGASQDGAQRNQALADMTEAAGADLPPEISQALENLDTGDLPAEAYAAAEQTLEAVCS